MTLSAAKIIASPDAPPLITDPAASVISEPEVGPSLWMVTALPEIDAFAANEISPEPVLVLPVPSRR